VAYPLFTPSHYPKRKRVVILGIVVAVRSGGSYLQRRKIILVSGQLRGQLRVEPNIKHAQFQLLLGGLDK
jgi:hypothetical protein